jgi:ATP-dependent DNA helicase RecG
MSLGGVMPGVTHDLMLAGVSVTRNEKLAQVFYRLNIIESYGTGIQKIMESYANAAEKPAIQPAPASFVVTLPKRGLAKNGFLTPEAQEKAVLEIVEQKGFITRQDVEQLLKIAKHPAVAVLNKLLNDGKIIKTGAARAVKYIGKT